MPNDLRASVTVSFEDLTEFESRLIRWISSSEFVEIPWSTRRAAEAFKVEEEEVYQALASLTTKVPENIQIFYEDGAIRIVADF